MGRRVALLVSSGRHQRRPGAGRAAVVPWEERCAASPASSGRCSRGPGAEHPRAGCERAVAIPIMRRCAVRLALTGRLLRGPGAERAAAIPGLGWRAALPSFARRHRRPGVERAVAVSGVGRRGAGRVTRDALDGARRGSRYSPLAGYRARRDRLRCGMARAARVTRAAPPRAECRALRGRSWNVTVRSGSRHSDGATASRVPGAESAADIPGVGRHG